MLLILTHGKLTEINDLLGDFIADKSALVSCQRTLTQFLMGQPWAHSLLLCLLSSCKFMIVILHNVWVMQLDRLGLDPSVNQFLYIFFIALLRTMLAFVLDSVCSCLGRCDMSTRDRYTYLSIL